mgnify:CR=1 FL=1
MHVQAMGKQENSVATGFNLVASNLVVVDDRVLAAVAEADRPAAAAVDGPRMVVAEAGPRMVVAEVDPPPTTCLLYTSPSPRD